MPYPCTHFYFDIKYGDRLYSKEKRHSSSLLNIIGRQVWYQSKSDYMDRALAMVESLFTYPYHKSCNCYPWQLWLFVQAIWLGTRFHCNSTFVWFVWNWVPIQLKDWPFEIILFIRASYWRPWMETSSVLEYDNPQYNTLVRWAKSNAWSMSPLSHRPRERTYCIVDLRIFSGSYCTSKLHPKNPTKLPYNARISNGLT